MSIFAGIKIDETAKVQEDRVGGSGRINTTGAYDVVIKKAWFHKAASGALGFTIEVETEDKQTLKVTEYVTNKLGETFYVDKSGNKQQMRGYSIMQAIDLLATGKDRSFPTTEEKQIKVWDSSAKSEVLKPLDCPTEWVNKIVTLLLIKEVKNKQEKNSEGTYVDVAGSVDSMNVAGVCNATTGKTRNETVSGIANGEFKTKWVAKYSSDYVSDRRSIKEEPTANSSQPTASAPSPFGD